jgi:hypothetical protein
MKNKILIVTLILVFVVIGIFAYKIESLKQEPKQTAQESRIQRDISEIRKFANSLDLAVQYDSDSKSSNGNNVPVGIYLAGADQYEVDASGKVVEVGSRNLPIGSENEKKYDNTPRYNAQELEAMARQLIAKNASDVNLEKLTLTKGNKDTNYFFRWEDKSQKTSEGYPYIQVGFSQGGTLLGYINTL